MLNRETIRPGKWYWVKRRKCEESVTLALMSGELPSLQMKVIDEHYIPVCSQYEFLAEADLNTLFNLQFKGTTVEELLAVELKQPMPTGGHVLS